MIISASRRTDIPAFFSDWFLNRINEGFACVRNPINTRRVSRIDLSPDVTDCIVFWSKNPKPLMEKLDALKDYMYYFQFTLNAYGTDIEAGLPPLSERIDTFCRLSGALGKARVIWRYDPILLNDSYTLSWHIKQYAGLAQKLSGYTERSTISFLDSYANIAKNLQKRNIHEPGFAEKIILAREFSTIAASCGLALDTCAEDIDLSLYNIGHARCIDGQLIERLLGCSLDAIKDKNQRPECGCIESIDIGTYNTCSHGCVYCYANHSPSVRKQNLSAFDAASPLLCSAVSEKDTVTERRVKSQKDMQLRLF